MHCDRRSVGHRVTFDAFAAVHGMVSGLTKAANAHLTYLNRFILIGAMKGEMVLTEISRKYHLEACVPSLEGFGFETEAVFTDERNWFALILLKRTDSLSESRERRT
jgi:uncharacterized SAM-dependent methyltransferase